MAIDFDALDLVRTQNKARLHEKKISDQKKKHELFIDARNKLDKLANAYNKADDQGIKEVYKNKWLELVKIYANKIQKGKNKMEYKFNEDQIFIIKWCLEIQESIWSKSKSSREYYDADLSRLNECLKIIANKIQKGKIK